MDARYLHRTNDWRIGKLVYQVFVDRFAPSLDLESKRHLYSGEKSLHAWTTLPTPGKKSLTVPYYAHELSFWGGDLNSLTSRLDYLHQLGIKTLYLNPIFDAFTNHKYDTINYLKISPEYGTMADFQHLLEQAHHRGIAVVLDGVFNHVSYFHPYFLDALKNPQSPYRHWFIFGKMYRHGYRSWHNAASLPELNLDHEDVRHYLFKEVVQHYLKMGVDGWRLDTAIELGFNHLTALTTSAHQIKKDTLVIGEILQYPAQWIPSVDAVIQLGLRDWILHTLLTNQSMTTANQQLAQIIQEVGIEAMLKSWIVLENHDFPRLKNQIKDEALYRLAKGLQFTLPGNVQIYQGEELGLTGGNDPTNREPFPWDQLNQFNQTYALHQTLIALREKSHALSIGDFVPLISSQFIAYARTTDHYQDTRIMLFNPSNEVREESLMIPFSKLPGNTTYIDLLTDQPFSKAQGIYLPIKLNAKSMVILKPLVQAVDGYLPTKYYL
jgi:cyclomaltodextrinase / maltogenic alpha-amylase / neopullulanase